MNKETTENKYQFAMLFFVLILFVLSLFDYNQVIINLIFLIFFLVFTVIMSKAPKSGVTDSPTSQKIRSSAQWFCTNTYIRTVFSGLLLPMFFFYHIGKSADDLLLEIAKKINMDYKYTAITLSFLISLFFEALTKYMLERKPKN